MKRWIFIWNVLILALGGCDTPSEFLDKDPTNRFTPSTLQELDGVLNNPTLSFRRVQNMFLVDPDVYMNERTIAAIEGNTVLLRAYLWNHELYNEFEDDEDYLVGYQNIFVFNEVLESIDEAETGVMTEEDRTDLKGEAYAQRAMELFLLVNEYAPHPDPSNPDQPGIPVPLSIDIEAQLPRESVEAVYLQILEDLTTTLDLWGEDYPARIGDANFRPGLASVYGMLAEVYLYLGDFQQAVSYGEQCLEKYNFLYDYNTIDLKETGNKWQGLDQEELFFSTTNRSVLWSRYHRYDYSSPHQLYHPDLEDLYDKGNDRRWYFWATSRTRFGEDLSPFHVMCFSEYETNVGITVPRVMLTTAEALVRTGRLAEGQALLERLHQHRLEDPHPVAENDREQLLELIKQERRKELAGTTLNIMDQKRYHVYGDDVPTYTRQLNTFIYALPPGEIGYHIAIPLKVRNANPNL